MGTKVQNRTQRGPAAAPPSLLVSPTGERLTALANLLVTYGPESSKVRDFIRANEHDAEFAELAPLSVALKRALASRADHPTT
jgi:hypothetical protein